MAHRNRWFTYYIKMIIFHGLPTNKQMVYRIFVYSFKGLCWDRVQFEKCPDFHPRVVVSDWCLRHEMVAQVPSDGRHVVYNMKWWFTTWKYQFHGCCRPFVGGKRHIVPIIVPWIDGGREVSRCARSDLRSWGDWRSAGSWGPICVDVSFYWFCTHIFITHIILIIFIYTFFCIHSQYNNV